ncbi:hypothetical protein HELRODRAFT_64166, partial [Helobdella robusta]|uniref:Angio-associated migratory cell protein n=1 Tax=Helobdella robusta TaxID=6412 RepID=T1FXQ7_HELRO
EDVKIKDEDDEEDEDDELINLKPERDDSSFVFSAHTDEVFCLAVTGSGEELLASGGKDDCCFVWKPTDGSVLFQCPGHTESVVCVAFSHDSKYLATGDLNGMVKAWEMKTGKEVWFFEVAEVQWLTWHQKVSFLLCGAVDGNIWLWNVPHGHTKMFPNHSGSAVCGSFFSDGKRMCAGYEDGSVNIWDLKTVTSLYSFPPSPRHHSSSVTCVDCHHGNVLVASGSCDGTVLLIKSSTGQLLNKLSIVTEPSTSRMEQEKEDAADERVESLSFSKSNQYIAVGGASGKVIVYDITTNHVRLQSNGHNADVVKIVWHPTMQDLLFSSSVDGSVIMWNVRTAQQVQLYIGHAASILDLNISRDGEKIYTASADHTVRVFETRKKIDCLQLNLC